MSSTPPRVKNLLPNGSTSDDPVTIEELLDHPMLRPAGIRVVCAAAKLLKTRREEGPPLSDYEQDLYKALRKMFFEISAAEKSQAFSVPDRISLENAPGSSTVVS